MYNVSFPLRKYDATKNFQLRVFINLILIASIIIILMVIKYITKFMVNNLLNHLSVPRYMCYFHCSTDYKKEKINSLPKYDRRIIEIKKKKKNPQTAHIYCCKHYCAKKLCNFLPHHHGHKSFSHSCVNSLNQLLSVY